MSAVLNVPPAAQPLHLDYLRHKLAFYTDAWDLALDLATGQAPIVVVDARSPEHYAAGHICGAINFPHRTMDAESTAQLDREKIYITYCDGIGCNGSTKAALRLAELGFAVKELIGGLDFWRRDGHPLTLGSEVGAWPDTTTAPECGC